MAQPTNFDSFDDIETHGTSWNCGRRWSARQHGDIPTPLLHKKGMPMSDDLRASDDLRRVKIADDEEAAAFAQQSFHPSGCLVHGVEGGSISVATTLSEYFAVGERLPPSLTPPLRESCGLMRREAR